MDGFSAVVERIYNNPRRIFRNGELLHLDRFGSTGISLSAMLPALDIQQYIDPAGECVDAGRETDVECTLMVHWRCFATEQRRVDQTFGAWCAGIAAAALLASVSARAARSFCMIFDTTAAPARSNTSRCSMTCFCDSR